MWCMSLAGSEPKSTTSYMLKVVRHNIFQNDGSRLQVGSSTTFPELYCSPQHGLVSCKTAFPRPRSQTNHSKQYNSALINYWESWASFCACSANKATQSSCSYKPRQHTAASEQILLRAFFFFRPDEVASVC